MASHDTTPLLSFLVPRNFPTTCNMGRPCRPSHLHLPLSIFELPIFLAWLLLLGLSSSSLFSRVSYPSISSNFSLSYPNIPGHTFYPTIHIAFLLWIFPAALLVGTFLLHALTTPHLPCLADIPFRILRLLPLRSLNSLFLPRYWTPP